MEIPFVSVIIPAFNSHQSLSKCLSGLQKQTYPADKYEVIVVDNGSIPSLESLVTGFEGVIYETESQIGSYAARNRGVWRSRGAIIAFTDADCIPQADWIEKGVAYLQQDQNCGLVGGRIIFLFKAPQSPTVWELCDQITFGFRQKTCVEQESYAITANAFTFRKVFDSVGLFDANLKSGGDTDWGKRVAKAGYHQCYGAEAIIRHPARATRFQLSKKARRLLGGLLDRERKMYGHAMWVVRNLFRLLTIGRRLIPGLRTVNAIVNYRNPSGEAEVLSASTCIKVALAYSYINLVQGLEVVRLLLGAESRRQ